MENNNQELKYNFSNLRILLTGFCMGAADIIPGVSGGTIAFIMGIYKHLVEAIKSFNLNFIKLICKFKIKEALSVVPLKFLIFLLAGIGIAIISMARIMSYLLENQRVYLFSFFFGLVVASIITISSKLEWNKKALLSLILGTIVAYQIVGLIPLVMPHDNLTLFLSGFVAIMAMILPGISGSFILLILGQYDFILTAVNERNILPIIPVGLGAVIGITSFSRLLSFILRKYYTITVAFLVGFLIGSLRKIWPWKEYIVKDLDVSQTIENNILPVFFDRGFVYCILLMIVGFLVLFFLDRIEKK